MKKKSFSFNVCGFFLMLLVKNDLFFLVCDTVFFTKKNKLEINTIKKNQPFRSKKKKKPLHY